MIRTFGSFIIDILQPNFFKLASCYKVPKTTDFSCHRLVIVKSTEFEIISIIECCKNNKLVMIYWIIVNRFDFQQ